MRLKNKVAVVTGASRGIGEAIAMALAGEGAKVAINYLKNAKLAENVADKIKAAGGHAIIVQADVSDHKQVESMVASVVKELGRVDILVNNAGINRDHTFKKMTQQEWDEVINVNLNGTFNCIHYFLPHLNLNARIINMSSITAHNGVIGTANYSAAKAGIESLTKTLARELGRDNISVNAIAPGYVETDMTANLPEKLRLKIIENTPLGRVGKPEEVAKLVIYLVTDGGYITGQVIHFNGGLLV